MIFPSKSPFIVIYREFPCQPYFRTPKGKWLTAEFNVRPGWLIGRDLQHSALLTLHGLHHLKTKNWRMGNQQKWKLRYNGDITKNWLVVGGWWLSHPLRNMCEIALHHPMSYWLLNNFHEDLAASIASHHKSPKHHVFFWKVQRCHFILYIYIYIHTYIHTYKQTYIYIYIETK